MDWRLARSLVQMRSELDTNFPKRDRESDGSIGDARHAAKSSDHNPWVHDHAGQPIVTAIDVDRDIASGFTSRNLAEWLRLRRDPRIKYVISNAQMYSSYANNSRKAWEWGPYTQSNKHFEHMHISVSDQETMFDSSKPWTIATAPVVPVPIPAPPHKPEPLPVTGAGVRPVLRLGSAGPDVGYLQRMLGKPAGYKGKKWDDNDFGPATQLAVKAFQKKAGIEQTGVVDQPTWAALIE